MFRYTIVILLAFLPFGCLEVYEPEVGPYDATLVVDGRLTDSQDTATVILSRAFAYSEDEPEYVSRAVVMIEDDQGITHALQENRKGIYQTDPALFSGEAGRSYRLLVTTDDGQAFESDWEQLKPAPPVGEVRYEYEERVANDPDEPGARIVPGIQFFVSTADPENNTRYYRWEYIATHEFTLWHPPLIQVEFFDPPGSGNGEITEVPADVFEGFACWETNISRQVFLATTEGYSQDIVKDYPLHFEDNSTPRLSARYSLLVKQYAISKAYYNYLRKLEEINQTTGSLFDPIPNEVVGNVHSADERSVPVLGYFYVAGQSSLRTFVNYSDLPPGFFTPVGPECVTDTLPLDLKVLYQEVEFNNMVLFDYLYSPFGAKIGFKVSEPPCTNCALNGATNERPEFW
ncbi:MAG: DUF4249 domain-containing protein, partial [Lewinella sp.]|nr:DUF4249 domain-containing protein [Lewinella sp.]